MAPALQSVSLVMPPTHGYSRSIRLVVGLLCLLSTTASHATTSSYFWRCGEVWSEMEGAPPVGQPLTKDAFPPLHPSKDEVPADLTETADAAMVAPMKPRPKTRLMELTARSRIDDVVTGLEKSYPGAQVSHAGSGGGGVTMRVARPDGTSLIVKMARIPWQQHQVDMLKKDPVVYAKAREADAEGSAHLVEVIGLTEVPTQLTSETALQMQDATEGALSAHLAEFGPGRKPLEVLQAWRQIALGVRALHRAQMVHRDLKPENILVAKGKDGTLTYLVSDFGVVFQAGDALPKGKAAGSLPYMSIEARSGAPPHPTHDLHSLRMTCMEMLMGHSVWSLDFDNPANNLKTLEVAGKRYPLLQALPDETALKTDPRLRRIVDAKFKDIDQWISAIDEATAEITSSLGANTGRAATP